MNYQLNPSLKFFLVIIISIEISFVASLGANLVIIIAALIYLLFNKVSLKVFILLIIAPLLAAIAIFIAIYYFSPGHNLHYALILFTRLYAFVFAGACLTQTITASQLARSLEQNLHLPSKFAYGTLAAFNVIPKIHEEVIRIRYAGLMRGMKLSFWSPRLYFKAILSAMSWAQDLSQGMLAHGYCENKKRSTLSSISLTKKDWLIFFTILLVFQPILFYFYL